MSFPWLGLVLEASFQVPRASLDFEAQGKVLSCPPSQLQTLGFEQVQFHHLPETKGSVPRVGSGEAVAKLKEGLTSLEP